MTLAAHETNAEKKANPLHRLSEMFKSDMAGVNQTIISRMHSDVPLIPQLASHLIAAGGKRLRPLLTVASAGICGYSDGDRHCQLAACVEFIHTATLLHDDVVDASDQRRGKESANAIFGNESAVLVGDFLFSRAFQLMVEDGSLDVLRILSNASAIIAEGEVMQLAAAHNLSTSEEQYFKVIRAKTAALFAAACETGAVVANADQMYTKAMHDYGLNLGIAFQIADDVLDYRAGSQLGKTLGDDLKEGKMTLPIIYAIQNADDDEKAFWYDTFVNNNITNESLIRAVEICENHKAFDRALDKAKECAKLAQESLNALPAHPARDIFWEMTDYVVTRKY